MNEIERMQKHLGLIRRAVGWSAEEFGDRIGVTRQTINNIEAVPPRSKLTKTQYIAMRSILDVEIRQHPEDTAMLRLLLDVFVDHPENYNEDEKKDLLNKANMLTPSILAGTTTREAVSEELTGSAVAAGIITGAMLSTIGLFVADAISDWLIKAIFDKKK